MCQLGFLVFDGEVKRVKQADDIGESKLSEGAKLGLSIPSLQPLGKSKIIPKLKVHFFKMF